MELKYCNHCPQNPKADPPLIEMKNVQIDAYVYDKIVSAGSNPSCLLCHTINDIIDTFKGKKA